MPDISDSTDNYPFASGHARDRIKERYHITPTDEEWGSAFLDIIEGRAMLLSANPKYERYLCSIRGIAFYAIYSPLSAKIVTVLPQGHVTKSTRYMKTLRVHEKPAITHKSERRINASWKLMQDVDD